MLLIHEFSAGACWGPGSAAAISCHPRGNASAEPELEESSSPSASAAPSRAALTFHKWLLYLPAIPTYVPHPGLPLTRAHLYIPVNLAHLISEPFPLAPPWRGVALGFDPRSQRQCRSPSLGLLWGQEQQDWLMLGSFPAPTFFPGLVAGDVDGLWLYKVSVSLPSPTHGSRGRLSIPSSCPQDHFSLHLHLPSAKSQISPQKMLFGQHLRVGIAI